VYCLCRRQVQDKQWQCGVCQLRGWQVFDEHRRNTGGNVSCVSKLFQLAKRKRIAFDVYLQRRVYWS
jgi:hypothetical protein